MRRASYSWSRTGPRAFFSARPETGPGRAVKSPARVRAEGNMTGPARGLLYFFNIFVLGLV
jgi:hypothetical protein